MKERRPGHHDDTRPGAGRGGGDNGGRFPPGDRPFRNEEDDDRSINEHTIIRALGNQLVDAFARTRNALIVLLLAAIILTVGVFNYRSSWLSVHAFREDQLRRNQELKEPVDIGTYVSDRDALVDAVNRESENNKPEYKRTLYHDLFDGVFKTVDVPVIGLEIYIEDLPLLGSFGLSVVLLWLYFARRRERGIMKMMHNKVNAYQNDLCKVDVVEYIYNTAAFNQTFNDVDNIDEHTNRRALKYGNVLARSYLNVLVFLPIGVLSGVVLLDSYETFLWHGPLRIPDEMRFTQEQRPYGLPEDERAAALDERLVQACEDTAMVYVQRIYALVDSPQTLPWKRHQATMVRGHMRNAVERTKKALTRPVSLWEYVGYYSASFDDMTGASLRMTIKSELIWIRTIVPYLMVLMCVVLTVSVYRVGKSRDEYFELIEDAFERMNDRLEHCPPGHVGQRYRCTCTGCCPQRDPCPKEAPPMDSPPHPPTDK